MKLWVVEWWDAKRNRWEPSLTVADSRREAKLELAEWRYNDPEKCTLRIRRYERIE